MVEPIMYLGIGFLAASLCGLLLLSLVHNRAVRLTKKRLEAAAPLSMAELQADKDQLRAEFAVTTRRLELLIEHLKSENAGQFAELGKRTDAINLFKIEINEKDAQIHALQLKQTELEDKLRATRNELAATTAALNEAEQTAAEKKADFVRISGEMTERELAADSQRVEIIALHAQVEALKGQVNDLRTQLNAAQMVETDLRARLAAAKQDTDSGWAKERAENAELRERINDIAAEIARLTMAKEGPLSPIEKLLAATSGTPSAAASANGGNGNGATTASGRPAVNDSGRTLADRIRAIQSRTPRQPTTT
jgi:chromosome segregation ATPase